MNSPASPEQFLREFAHVIVEASAKIPYAGLDELIKDWAKILKLREQEAEAKGIFKGRRAETDLLRGIAQDNDSLTPDEYEAILLVLNDRLIELDTSTDYRKGAGWTI